MFQTFATKDSDAAKYYQATLLVDEANYSEAITVIQSMTTSGQELRETRALLASAYAGRAGVNFLSLIETFSSASGRLFPFLTQSFTGAPADKVSDLTLAQASLEAISADYTERTNDENIFLAIVYLAKIGNIFSTYMDDDDDGSLDGSFVDACTAADSEGVSIGDGNVGEVGYALLNTLKIMSDPDNNVISGVLTGSLSSCDSLEAESVLLTGICSVESASDFTGAQVKAFRSLMKEDSLIGFGVSCSGNLAACNCP